MAMSASVQSILASPVTGLASRGRSGQLVPGGYAPCRQRNASRQVRCTAEDGQKEESTPAATSPPSTKSTPPPSTKSTPPPPPKARVSTKFSDVLAFNGPAPERINGRLAMIGFTAAVAVEALNGEDLFAQISNGGIAWFVGTSAVLTLASLVPLFRGVSVEGENGGLMTADAELWNGRLAMLGLVALALTEYVKGGALVMG